MSKRHPYEAEVMKMGDTVILTNKVSSYLNEVKFVMIKCDSHCLPLVRCNVNNYSKFGWLAISPGCTRRNGQSANIARASVPHAALVGHPFGTKFEVSRQNKKTVIVPSDEDASALVVLEDLQGEEDVGGKGNASTEIKTDNRHLVDMNALTKGKESSQKLDANDIEELKRGGVDGKGLMKTLIENSATFKSKTEFSQEKWVKRKSAKYTPSFTAYKATSLSLCRAYFLKEPSRICHMREDSLARLLTISNVQQGSRALVVDSMNGLLTAAVAERMGGVGRIMNGYNGLQPSVDAVRWMNFDQKVLDTIMNFPISELPYMEEDMNVLCENAAKPQISSDPPGKEESARRPPEADPENLPDSEKVEEQAAAAQIEDTYALRRRRLEVGYKANMSFRQDGSVSQARPTVVQIQEELRKGFDSLVVGGTLHPMTLVPPLVKLLKPSSTFVVYSPYAQPLLELMEKLMKDECALEMDISETWMREYQVLEGRTHPAMHMSAASGFLLTGIRVIKNSKPGPPVLNAASRKEAEGGPTAKRQKTDSA